MRRLLFVAIAMLSIGVPALAQDEVETLRFGYLEIADDPRFDEDRVYARIALRPLGRAFAGVEIALGEADGISRVIKKSFAAERYEGTDIDDLLAKIDEWVSDDIHFIMLDMPGDSIREIMARTAGRDDDMLLLNIAAPDDDLRGENCAAHVMHVMPSYAMQMDALLQFLVFKKWTNILVLKGPLEDDAKMGAALERAIRKFGAKIADTRPFVLSNDPRIREQNNVALMTAGGNYDVVVIVDSDGEFGRYVPYNINLPRPVLGSAGLSPEVWHWSYERHGAPQLNSRFERANPRRMTGFDWTAWAGTKTLVQAVLRTQTTDFATLRDYIKSPEMKLDGFKGPALNYRPWDNQLRQTIFLATQNAIIEQAPIRGFLHTTNDLDTLGVDAPETQCRF